MSISWGRRERFKFTAGGTLMDWSPPILPAVYAITYKQDPKNKPKSHTVLYFGQADDLSQQAPTDNRQIMDSWVYSGGTVEELYVFIHPMPGSTRGQRSNLQEQLVAEYGPDCNRY